MSNEFINCGSQIIRRDKIKSVNLEEQSLSIIIYDLDNNSCWFKFDDIDSLKEVYSYITAQLLNSN